jgi:hypothetical protein
VEVSPIERAAIAGMVLGEELGIGDNNQRLSNGVFAILLAIWAGVPAIEICGFSLEGGHSYSPKMTPREHLLGDTRSFELMRRLDSDIRTTSIELSERFGFPLSAVG